MVGTIRCWDDLSKPTSEHLNMRLYEAVVQAMSGRDGNYLKRANGEFVKIGRERGNGAGGRDARISDRYGMRWYLDQAHHCNHACTFSIRLFDIDNVTVHVATQFRDTVATVDHIERHIVYIDHVSGLLAISNLDRKRTTRGQATGCRW